MIYGLESYGFCQEGEALDFISELHRNGARRGEGPLLVDEGPAVGREEHLEEAGGASKERAGDLLPAGATGVTKIS